MITVYTLDNCQQCRMTTMWLDRAGADYTTTDLTQDAGALAAVKALGYQTAPVVIATVGGEERHWAGFQPTELMRAVNGRAA